MAKSCIQNVNTGDKFRNLLVMARANYNYSFEMCYEIKFKTAIRGHHEYKTTWTPVMNEWLICKKDERHEAVV